MAEHAREPAPTPAAPVAAPAGPAPAGATFVPTLTALGTDGILALQQTAGNRAVARLIQDGAPVDIDTLSEAAAREHSQRIKGETLPVTKSAGSRTWNYEAGDDVKLAARAGTTKGDTLKSLDSALGGDTAEHAKRNINLPLKDVQALVDKMSKGGGAPGVSNFDEWLFGNQSKMLADVENRWDHINELREAEKQPSGGGDVDLSETSLPGSVSTTDLKQGDTQTEVKTVREPIDNESALTGQIRAALEKFASATSKPPGAKWRAVVYASYDAALIAGRKRKGADEKLDPTTGKVTRTFPKAPKPVVTDFFPKLLDMLNGSAAPWPDLAKNADELTIRMENGPDLVFAANKGVWTRTS